jgi:hypothetical protein
MNARYNVWCKWHPLKTVILGDCYPVSFYQGIKNDRIKSALTRITEETLEDLAYYETVLKDFGCDVLRPKINKDLSIMDFVNNQDSLQCKVPRAPLQPRDWQFVLGNKLYIVGDDSNGEFRQLLSDYNKEDMDDYTSVENSLDYNMPRDNYVAIAGENWPSYDDYLNKNFQGVSEEILDEIKSFGWKCITVPASSTLVGRDLYLDYAEGMTSTSVQQHYMKSHPNLRINQLRIGGHSDGVFHTIKEGALLSLHNIQMYEKTFPGWDICYLPNQSWNLVKPFTDFKDKVGGKWWVPGEEDNDEFTAFVETWLNDWVGYCEESVFDVNVLMLDEKHVCVNNYNETAFAFFKKHNIEPIIVPFRHRYLWDGGLHCLTLDLYREGKMEDYFPNRVEGITDLGFD